jgi:FdhD protein
VPDSRDDDDPRFRRVTRVEWIGESSVASLDAVVCEEPLEIRIAGLPIAVVMRTPGHDLELVRGFLLSERIVAGLEQIESVRHCTTVPRPEAEDNVVLVIPRPELDLDLARLRRNFYASSSCGLCGRASIDAVIGQHAARLPAGPSVYVDLLRRLPERLRAGQQVFERTGGLHAAGLFTPAGEALVIREDVGRHNAVDKVIGWAAVRGLRFAELILVVSGRISFEITQKAALVGLPIIVAVSAPSSLAIELAERVGMSLIGFVRSERACVYAGAERISPRLNPGSAASS